MSHKAYYKDLKNIVNALNTDKNLTLFVNLNKSATQTPWTNIKKTCEAKKKPELTFHNLNDPNIINDHLLKLPGKLHVP